MENAIHRLILPHDVAVRIDASGEAQRATGHVDRGEPGVFQQIAVCLAIRSVVASNDVAVRVDIDRHGKDGAGYVEQREFAVAEYVPVRVTGHKEFRPKSGST
jgi:hypothetical protein